VKPKKSLGQHFLTDKRHLLKIRDAINPVADDILIEIGPGKGALTRELVPLSEKLIAIEKDPDMVHILEREFANEIASGKLELLEQDVRTFDPSHLSLPKNQTYKVIGNIPYYITGAIIRHFLEADHQPTDMALLIQREVAERVLAQDEKESILSLSVKLYGTPRMKGRVPPGAFNPPPNVDSAILLIEDISHNKLGSRDKEELFFELVRAAFKHKRKTAHKNLCSYWNRADVDDAWESLSLDPRVRAEDLPLNVWISLTEMFYTGSHD
jgi:16S rRNA (adenine1518-N6/adenine1519-N6)-dimethyltransferase